MKQIQFSEDEFSSSEDDSTTHPPTKKSKNTGNRMPTTTNQAKDAKKVSSVSAMPPGYIFIRSDLIGNYWAHPKVPVPVVITLASPITENGENTLLCKQLEEH